MKRILSISYLILPLLALASALSLSAQTLVVDKTALNFQAQVGGSPVNQTLNVTSSTGAPISFTLSTPSFPWIKFNGLPFGFVGTTPVAVTVSADPTGFAAGTVTASIAVNGGSAVNNPIAVSFTIGAISASPTSLALTYTVGSSAFPASQVIALSSAVATQCTATAVTTSGGSWFTLLQNACVSPGSLTVLINTSVVAGLPAATYNGTVTITPSPAGPSPAIVVPVTLTVSPTPPVTIDPASLIFNWQTGTANPSQTFTVSASQPLNVGVVGQVDTGAWSFSVINTGTGAISATTGALSITVTVNPNGIAPGTYTGHITVLVPGGNPSQTNIPVTLNVSNAPLLNVPNATLRFFSQLGTSAPAAQTVNITSTGTLLSYAVSQSANSPWLSVPNAGNTATPLTVSVNPAGLTPGTYSATVNVVSATPGSAVQQFPVVLKVTNDPVITASVSALSIPFQIGQAAPPARTIKITSSTGVPLNYTASLATTACGATWLQAANANNSLSGVTDDTLTVSVAIAGLSAGICTGTVTINATNPATGAAAVNSPLNIPVTLYVSATALLVATPANLLPFSVGVGAQSPAAQSIVLTSTDTNVLNYQVAIQPQNSWLSVNTLGGSTNASQNVLTVTVNSSGLAVGVYSGTVTVIASELGVPVLDSPLSISVTLTVTSGSLTLSSSDLTFPDQTLGGPAPASQTVTIGSIGQALNYTALANSNNPVTWLFVSPASGNTSTSGVLTVSVDGSKLTPGTYTGAISVSSPGASNTPITINVHLKVNPGTLSAPTTTLTFTQASLGAAPPAQSIAVTGSPAPLSFTVASAMLNGANWLSATPASGTTPASVQVSVNGAALPVGQYIGSVTITSPGAAASPIAVPVILNVVTPAVIAASPTSLTFGYIIGQPVPAAQNLAVTATSTAGNVPFSATVQLDGAFAQWLAVTPASGTTPATLAVSVAPTTLLAGTYTGRVVIASSNALVAATIPVTLTVTAIPIPVVTAVANAATFSTGAVSPGENIVIFGSGIGPAAITLGTVVNNAFVTLAGATRVLFDGTPAPVIYASNGQTSVMVPYVVSGRATTNIVVEFSGVQSVANTFNVALAAPGIYTLNQQGTGPGAILNQDGITVNGLTTPEKRGNVIAIYMTGEGATTPQGSDGAIIAPVLSALKHPILPVTVTVGGVDAVVQYAGSAPGLVSGVMQVNVTIPLTAPTGNAIPVVVTVGTAKTQSGASPATAVTVVVN